MILYGIILNLREKTLSEAMKEKKISSFTRPVIIINKNNYHLYLYEDTILVKTYKAVFGKSSRMIKESFIDKVTPSGDYYICYKDSLSRYRRFLLLNYPNPWDVIEAYKRQWITKEEYSIINANVNNNKHPFDNMEDFFKIGIHGMGTYDFIFKNLPFAFNWTNGSIAVSNEDIEELYGVVKYGTPVSIKE